MIIAKLLLFTFLINWCISLQILNQTLQKGKQKTAAVILSFAAGCLAGLILLL